jgi:hypothetical protein
MTKKVAMQPAGGFVPGGEIDMSKMEPVNYTKGDVVFTGKVAGKTDGKVTAEFTDAPADWNKADRAFEFAAGDYLVQVTGFPNNETSAVFLRVPDAPAKQAQKKPTVQKPAASGVKKDSTK